MNISIFCGASHMCAVKMHEYSFHYHKKQCCN